MFAGPHIWGLLVLETALSPPHTAMLLSSQALKALHLSCPLPFQRCASTVCAKCCWQAVLLECALFRCGSISFAIQLLHPSRTSVLVKCVMFSVMTMCPILQS